MPSRLTIALLILVATGSATTILLRAQAKPATPAGQAARELPVRLVPPELKDTAWLEGLKQAELKAAASAGVFHDFQFTDRQAESGITFRHRIVADAGKVYKAVHYDHGNGLAIADVDGDGLVDLYFVNQVGSSELWKNLGGGTFSNITATAGVGVASKIGVSAAFADIDNDGDADLYVTTVRGGNVLFENDGKGRFRDISAASGTNYVGHSSSAVFFDYNRDGRLDLFLVNVGKYTTNTVGGVGYKVLHRLRRCVLRTPQAGTKRRKHSVSQRRWQSLRQRVEATGPSGHVVVWRRQHH